MKRFGWVVVALLAISLPLYAVPTLQLQSGATIVTVADQGPGDSNPAVGAVTWIGSIGSFNVNVSTGLSKPISGTPSSPNMDLNSVDHSTGAGTLTVRFSDDNFTGTQPAFVATIGGTTAGTVQYDTYVDSTNTIFGTETQLTSITATTTPFDGADTSSVGAPAGPYSLTQVVTITHKGAGSTSFDATLAPVPEPMTVLLLGSGLAALGLLQRKRKTA